MSKKETIKFYAGIASGFLKASFQTVTNKAFSKFTVPSTEDKIVDTFKVLSETKDDLYSVYPEKVTSDGKTTTYWSFKTVLMDNLSSKGWPIIQSSSWDDANPPPEHARNLNCQISNALGTLMRCGRSEVMIRFELADLEDRYPEASDLIYKRLADISAAAAELETYDLSSLNRSRTYKMLGNTGPLPL